MTCKLIKSVAGGILCIAFVLVMYAIFLASAALMLAILGFATSLAAFWELTGYLVNRALGRQIFVIFYPYM